LVHLLAMQLTARVSPRDCVSSLKARIKSLYHLGVKPVARSTFADANNKRPASFFEALFGLMYRRCQPLAPKHKFKFKNKLFSLDATVVSLCLTLFPWASFRRTKGGVKLHTLYDHAGYLPAFMAISPAREHEIKKARSLASPKVPLSWRTWATPITPGTPNSPPRKSSLSRGRRATPALRCWRAGKSIKNRACSPTRLSG
jgi:putative transposase